jgi:hypothetical protein
MKLVGPVAESKAKSAFDLFQKKRMLALSIIWDFQHIKK